LMTLEGEVKTTLSFELSGGTLGGLTWIPESQEFAAVELTRRERLVINRAGRLVEACFPRNLLPPVPLPEEQQLNFGMAYDGLQGTLFGSHDDGLIRELYREVDTQGGCVVTDFSFGLERLGGAVDPGTAFRGIVIAGNTLIVCGAESNALFEVLIHPFTREFRRGDADRDGALTLADAVRIAAYLFGPGAAMLQCLDAADTNDDGVLDVSDPVYILFYLFLQGPAPPIPFDDPGTDPTFRDNLGCEE
ncbi:MAG: dockerin type I repeat-containing protein, partial [Actinobacteria bacterium]|nr:dockerin type I repeat-containing protein [Actinomycetota bacterium]